MDNFRADLHCHSTCSDGTVSPEDLVRLAKERGLSGLSITDHDTVAAYALARPVAKEIGIDLISGVEFSAAHNGVSVHILGYGFDPDDTNIANLCSKHVSRRIERLNGILHLLALHNMPITMDEILEHLPQNISNRSLGRPHIAAMMVIKGYATSISDAFQRYLGDGMPCCTPGEAFSVEETLAVIHQAKGVAILAHPHLMQDSKTLCAILEKDFDGLECYYGMFAPNKHKRWLKIANQKKWLITGGSDFHGSVKPKQVLGSSWIGSDNFLALKERIKECRPTQN